MLKIRLMRIGARKKPFYRVVAVDERNKRTGAYIEALGTYNPLSTPHEIILKQDRIDHWIKQGAQMSDGYLRIIGKAKQHPARKPKKQKPEEKAPTPAAPVERPEETVATPDEVVETPAEIATSPEAPRNDESEETKPVEEKTEVVPEPEPAKE